MVGLVLLLAVVVAMLTVLVIGLLRSYGEVLRRLHEAGLGLEAGGPAAPTAGAGAPGRGVDEAADIAGRLDAGVAPPRQGDAEAWLPAVVDVVGVTPAGDAVAVGLRGSDRVTMLAFLSSGCGTCANFWAALRNGEQLAVGGRAVRLVVVTGGPQHEAPAAVAALAGAQLTVVMSDDAWQHYAVPATPYFVLLDGAQGILGEGSAMGWAQLVGLLERAVNDRGFDLQSSSSTPASVIDLRPGSAPARGAANPAPVRGAERADRVDAALLAAGIGPGDEQLYRAPFDPGPGPGPGSAAPAGPPVKPPASSPAADQR